MNTVRNIIVVTLAVLVTLASTALVISPVVFAQSAQVPPGGQLVSPASHSTQALVRRSSRTV